MAYDEKIIEQVQSLNDIAEVISSYIPLKRTGRSFKANCPFHNEKTPSFNVNAEKQIFHCFGCGEGGDVITFVMKYEQLNFPEALKLLASRVHVTLPESKFQRSEKSNADLMYQIYEKAQEFYHASFMKSPAAGRARAYWKSRGFGEKEAEQFGIGYSFEDWQKLCENLTQKGFSQDALLKSGLIARSSQGTYYDWFRGRLMFPIRNAQGRVVAFGGRVFSDETPKYLNSQESEIFKKRREFYGLFVAKNSLTQQKDMRRFLIVEGYMDCIQLQAHGFLNAVATLGTALTEEHVRVLKRYIDEAIVVYDGDRAGEQAALRGLDVFLVEGMNARAVSLPDGLDPDDFLRERGEDAFRAEIEQAQDIFDFKLKILLGRFNKTDSSGLLKITSEFLDMFSKISNQVLLDRYLKKLAGVLGIDERSVRTELEKLKSKTKGMERSKPSDSKPELRASEPVYEKMLLSFILHYSPYFKEFRQAVPLYQFIGERTRELFQFIGERAQAQPDSDFSGPRFLNAIESSPLKSFASELMMMDWETEDREKGFYDCVQKIKKMAQDTSLEEMRRRIERAEKLGDQALVTKLIQEYQEFLGAVKPPTTTV